jgi:hypothetical protein
MGFDAICDWSLCKCHFFAPSSNHLFNIFPFYNHSPVLPLYASFLPAADWHTPSQFSHLSKKLKKIARISIKCK